MIKNLKENKGITLIALVITIIVLLILAGVAISMLSGEHGILNQAARAKTETEKKSIEEAIHLATLAAMTNTNHGIEEGTLKNELNGYFGEDGYTIEGDAEKGWTVKVKGRAYTIANNGDMVEEKSFTDLKKTGETVKNNTEIVEDDGDKIVIPANFNVASDSRETVEEGIIIEDSQDNQYVWIPILGVNWESVEKLEQELETDSKNEKKEEEYYTAIETALKDYTKDYKDASYTDKWYQDSTYGYNESGKTVKYSNGNLTENQYNDLYHSMLKSVYTNEGFYIGRYEMGISVVNSTEEAQTKTRTSSNKEYTAGNSDSSSNGKPKIGEVPVSKADAVPYTWITQSQAEMLAEKLGQGEDYKDSVYTSIMFGVQWDAVCVFIEKYDKNPENKTTTKSDWLKNNNFGKLWGNYLNSTYTMDRGFYNIYRKFNLTEWEDKSSTLKPTSESWLCTTGASEQNSSLNIYDIGGNVAEWTLESYNYSDEPCVFRGSDIYNNYYASCHSSAYMSYSDDIHSSRFTLYIK